MKRMLGTTVATIMVALFIGTFIALTCATAGGTARDSRFIANSDGTVLDTRTNLMWAAKDNGSDINWEDAKNYCKNYRGGKYKDWRMPTQAELAGLFDVSKTYMAACGPMYPISGDDIHITELIRLTCYRVWASETRDSTAAIFNLSDGHRPWLPTTSAAGFRALPVRSGK